MPSHYFEIRLVQGSTRTFTLDMYEDDTATEHVAESTDQVRFKVWQTDGAAPDLDLSNTVNANGSRAWISVNGVADTTPATASIRVGQADTLAMSAGVYKAELGFIDDSATNPADAYTVVAQGRITLVGSATGDRGKV